MKSVWLIGLSMLALATPASAQMGNLERGGYLVNTVLTCGNCHTPKGPTGDIAGKEFAGGMRFDEPPFDVTSSNITQDKETGIGNWSAADIRKTLRTGVRPNGVPLAAIMPTGFYEIMTDEDMDNVVGYVMSLKPISNKIPDPIYKINVPRAMPPGADKPFKPSDMTDKVKRGFYLATIAHCMECHTPLGPRGRDFENSLGKGGFEFTGPWGKSVSRNITSSKTAGVGAWTDDEIKRAITQGLHNDGTPLKPPMGYPYYAKMNAADLDAVVAWLRTVPAKD